MKKGTMLAWGSVVLSFVGYSLTKSGQEGIGEFLLVAPLLTTLPYGCIMNSREKKAAYEALPPDEKARVDAERERKVSEAKAKLAEMEERQEQMKAASTIVSTAIVDTTMKSKTKASATSSVVRGAVGCALFGPVGMVAGAVTPKKKTITKAKTVTFSVRYANGECRLETVKVGSARYKELAKYIA